MPLTLFYAQFLGSAFLVIGLGILLNRRSTVATIRDVIGSKSTIYVLALVSLFVGLVVVLTHNEWTSGPATLVSFLGWALTLRGIAFLLVPHASLERFFSHSLNLDSISYAAGPVALLVGVYLSYAGFGG